MPLSLLPACCAWSQAHQQRAEAHLFSKWIAMGAMHKPAMLRKQRAKQPTQAAPCVHRAYLFLFKLRRSDEVHPVRAKNTLQTPSQHSLINVTAMATPQGNNDAGRMILTNATPYAWKRSLNKPKGMKTWNFPAGLAPGASVVCLIAFQGGNGAHGQASYQVCEEDAGIMCCGPRGTLSSRYFCNGKCGGM